MKQNEKQPIVFDFGSFMTRIGYAGPMQPSVKTNTIVGSKTLMMTPSKKKSPAVLAVDYYYGMAAMIRSDVDRIHPVINGQVQNMQMMEKFLSYLFKEEIKHDPKTSPIVMTDKIGQSGNNRGQMAQLLFEKFSIPSLYIEYPVILALYACGKTTGVSINSGYQTTQVCSVQDGLLLDQTIINENHGGQTVNNELVRLLNFKFKFDQKDLDDIINEIKGKYCYVSLNINEDSPKLQKMKGTTLKMPDGEILTITNQRVIAPQILFNNSNTKMSLQQMICQSIKKSSCLNKQELFQNIVFSGGNTNFKNFQERLTEEIFQISPPRQLVSVQAPPHIENAPWIGGSILAQLQGMDQCWVTQKQFKEVGENIFFQNYQ